MATKEEVGVKKICGQKRVLEVKGLDNEENRDVAGGGSQSVENSVTIKRAKSDTTLTVRYRREEAKADLSIDIRPCVLLNSKWFGDYFRPRLDVHRWGEESARILELTVPAWSQLPITTQRLEFLFSHLDGCSKDTDLVVMAMRWCLAEYVGVDRCVEGKEEKVTAEKSAIKLEDIESEILEMVGDLRMSYHIFCLSKLGNFEEILNSLSSYNQVSEWAWRYKAILAHITNPRFLHCDPLRVAHGLIPVWALSSDSKTSGMVSRTVFLERWKIESGGIFEGFNFGTPTVSGTEESLHFWQSFPWHYAFVAGDAVSSVVRAWDIRREEPGDKSPIQVFIIHEQEHEEDPVKEVLRYFRRFASVHNLPLSYSRQNRGAVTLQLGAGARHHLPQRVQLIACSGQIMMDIVAGFKQTHHGLAYWAGELLATSQALDAFACRTTSVLRPTKMEDLAITCKRGFRISAHLASRPKSEDEDKSLKVTPWKWRHSPFFMASLTDGLLLSDTELDSMLEKQISSPTENGDSFLVAKEEEEEEKKETEDFEDLWNYPPKPTNIDDHSKAVVEWRLPFHGLYMLGNIALPPGTYILPPAPYLVCPKSGGNCAVISVFIDTFARKENATWRRCLTLFRPFLSSSGSLIFSMTHVDDADEPALYFGSLSFRCERDWNDCSTLTFLPPRCPNVSKMSTGKRLVLDMNEPVGPIEAQVGLFLPNLLQQLIATEKKMPMYLFDTCEDISSLVPKWRIQKCDTPACTAVHVWPAACPILGSTFGACVGIRVEKFTVCYVKEEQELCYFAGIVAGSIFQACFHEFQSLKWELEVDIPPARTLSRSSSSSSSSGLALTRILELPTSMVRTLSSEHQRDNCLKERTHFTYAHAPLAAGFVDMAIYDVLNETPHQPPSSPIRSTEGKEEAKNSTSTCSLSLEEEDEKKEKKVIEKTARLTVGTTLRDVVLILPLHGVLIPSTDGRVCSYHAHFFTVYRILPYAVVKKLFHIKTIA